ncbi:uncharacterized protein LOC133877915 isoform X2 [Alnus glutinosa]|uniref:uncharacterized protein LOC133877915 isoform X2 n=1 Tax=Alnus glutinosa TaxID=3517 RepID=UPI002D7997DC|nr:uncharacterized protein LOC133877915 isoform X2 [Alnus glutinosa]
MNSYKPSNRDSIFLQSLNPLHLYTNLSQTPKPHAQETPNNHRAQILKEETKIEREIIKAVTAGKLDSLRPNSGQSVPIGEHYVCVSSHEEPDSDCRVWEWHGHVVFYDEENGFAQEYVYGNYFERTMRKVFGDESDEESEERSLGLGDLVAAMSLSDWPPPFSRKMGANYCSPNRKKFAEKCSDEEEENYAEQVIGASTLP